MRCKCEIINRDRMEVSSLIPFPYVLRKEGHQIQTKIWLAKHHQSKQLQMRALSKKNHSSFDFVYQWGERMNSRLLTSQTSYHQKNKKAYKLAVSCLFHQNLIWDPFDQWGVWPVTVEDPSCQSTELNIEERILPALIYLVCWNK